MNKKIVNMKKNKTLLWVVDCQNDFMNEDGKLYVPGSEQIKSNIHKKISEHEKNGGSIVYTQDWHYHDSEELSINPDFVNTFPEHCMSGTYGADLIDEVKPNGYNSIINWDQKMKLTTFPKSFKILLRKDKFDFVSGNPNSSILLHSLEEEFTDIEVIGVSGNVCVNKAVIGLTKVGFHVRAIMNCIASLPNIPSCDKEWKELGVELI